MHVPSHWTVPSRLKIWGLYCLPNVSTRYRDREASVQAVSDALAQLVQARTGNYFAFFPSYAYLRQVHEDFAARYPGIRTLVQESRLDDAARAEFLAQFVPDPAETLLGFGVRAASLVRELILQAAA